MRLKKSKCVVFATFVAETPFGDCVSDPFRTIHKPNLGYFQNQ